MKRLALITAVVVAAGLAAVGVVRMSTGVDASQTAASALNWSACNEEGLEGLDCATLQVPMDYAKPNGQKITLALSRATHTGTSGYQGALLVNPGGPGGEGRSFAARVAGGLPDSLKATYDVIGFDPRGVGASTPSLSCDANYFKAVRPDYLPTTTEATWLKKSAAYTKACGAKYGSLLSHMKTTDSVRDMDAIRAALGQQKINYYGASYGTYLGSVYATMFPSHVRRMVLDSNVQPSHAWYQANLDQDVAFEKNFNALMAWIAKYDSVYHVGTTQKAVRDFYFATRAKIAKAPAGGVVGGDELDDTFLVGGYIDLGPYWPFLANALSTYKAGSDQALVDAYNTLGITADDSGYPVYTGVECTDVQWPTNFKTWKRDNTRLYNQGTKFETWGNAWYNAPCLTWPAAAGKPVDVGHAAGIPPILLFQATNDGPTPFPGGLEMNRRLKGSRLVIEDGGRTHGVVERGNTCIDSKFAAYLTDGTLPANQVHCNRLPEPVPPSSTAAAQAQARALSTGGQKFPPVLRGRP